LQHRSHASDFDRSVSNALLLHIVDSHCADEAPAQSKKLHWGNQQQRSKMPVPNKKRTLHTNFSQPGRRAAEFLKSAAATPAYARLLIQFAVLARDRVRRRLGCIAGAARNSWHTSCLLTSAGWIVGER